MPTTFIDGTRDLSTLFVNAAGRGKYDTQVTNVFAKRISELLFNGDFDTVDNFLETLRDDFMADLLETSLDEACPNYAKLHVIAWALGQAMPYRHCLTNIESVARIIETHPLWILPSTHSEDVKRFHTIFRGCGISRKAINHKQ